MIGINPFFRNELAWTSISTLFGTPAASKTFEAVTGSTFSVLSVSGAVISSFRGKVAEIMLSRFDNFVGVYGNGVYVMGSDGNDWVQTSSHTTVHGGAGDDMLSAHYHATLDGGAGNDHLTAFAHATLSGGAGDDILRGQGHSTLVGGTGNDFLTANDHAILSGGTGNDLLSAYDHAVLSGGDGNDVLGAYDHGVVSGGAGDDVIEAYRYADVDAGAGDDAVRATAFATVDGGDGDDTIQVGKNSEVTGGAGNDEILLDGANTTVYFGRGHGHDVISVSNFKQHASHFRTWGAPDMISVFDGVAINVADYKKDDVTVSTQEDGTTLVSFNGSNDSITLDLNGAPAELTFADGSTLTVETQTDKNSNRKRPDSYRPGAPDYRSRYWV